MFHIIDMLITLIWPLYLVFMFYNVKLFHKHIKFIMCQLKLKILFTKVRKRMCLFFLVVLGFEFRALYLLERQSTTWATLPALFCVGCFLDRVFQIICLNWLQTVILLISASWIARIIGVSHQCLTVPNF
jgi:hypothetical protein